jgi:hypothetical protein
VSVRKEQGKIERAAFEFGEERLTEPTQAGSSVENDNVVAATNLDTGCVASIADRARSRCGYRAAYTPKFDVRGGFDGENLAQPGAKMKLKKCSGFRPRSSS